MIINVWLTLRDDAQNLIKIRLNWDEETKGEYVGPVSDRQFKLFRLMHDRAIVQRLFRVDKRLIRDWTLWSLYFDLPTAVLQKVKDELDALTLAFPNRVKIIGAWNWDGGQVEQGGSVVYPIHNRILKLMPDIVTFDIDTTGPVPVVTEISRDPATVPADVNLGFGQAPRQF